VISNSTRTTERLHWLPSILEFLQQIGIVVRAENMAGDSFLPGVKIEGGTLVYDAEKLLVASDLLHEAGHVAVTPAARRAALNDAIAPEQQLDFAGEVEAIAWSFAAACHLGIPLSVLFHSDGYRGQSPGLALSFSMGVYPGVHGLTMIGLAANREQSDEQNRYPKLMRWLRA
jgi:hypothetical protein